jgi:uncharacterized YccA/Bax inhibitor family protein
VISIFDWGRLDSESFRTVGLVVTVIAVILAAPNLAAPSLVLDFGTIEAGVEADAPEEYGSHLAFSLMVTLIWIHAMLLRRLAVPSLVR